MNALNKSVLISIKPCYANLLVDGIKKIELRRKFPSNYINGTKLFIYASAPISKVIGECYIKKVDCLPIEDLWNESCIDAMISWADFNNYFFGREFGFAIHVSGYFRYETPFALSEIDFLPPKPPQSYCYVNAQESIL